MRILIVCGGTGGHIFPALALAEELRRRGYRDIIFITDPTARTKELIDSFGFNSLALDVPKMPYGFSIKWFSFFIRFFLSYLRAEVVIGGANPDIVIGFGAYISGPVISVAKSLGKKILIHEQNVSLGRANKLLLKKADRVCFSFNNKLSTTNSGCLVTGNPIRSSVIKDLKTITKIDALSCLNLSKSKKTVLVFGGSSGASPINNLFIDFSKNLSVAEKETIQLIHITGPRDMERVCASYREAAITFWVRDFYERMSLLYKAADMAVCRSGATTIAEIAIFGLPAIFIPYPDAGGHQMENALAVRKNGGSIILAERDTTREKLKVLLLAILNNNRKIIEMGANMRSMAMTDATSRVAEVVEGLANA